MCISQICLYLKYQILKEQNRINSQNVNKFRIQNISINQSNGTHTDTGCPSKHGNWRTTYNSFLIFKKLMNDKRCIRKYCMRLYILNIVCASIY